MNGTRSTGTEALLQESAWLHGLARRLVSDPGLAADAAQETLLAAHAKQPGATRRWLASVLRNALRQGHRARLRRRDHEALAALGEVDVRSAADTVARLDAQRLVVDAVRALDEPYRTTITLRFLESLPPREVARRTGVPVKTVHTRVERGLDRLRERLDASFEGRPAWIAALVPIARGHGGGAILGAAGAGAILMGTMVKVGGAAAGLVVLVLLIQRAVDGSGAPEQHPPVMSTARPADVQRPIPLEDGEPLAEPRRSAVALDSAAVSSEPEVASEPAAAPPRFRGRVIDLEGRPMSGLDVRFEPTSFVDEPLAPAGSSTRSDARGEFELDLLPFRGRLTASGRGHATLVAPGIAGVAPPEPPVVIVAPERTFAGRVIDEEGRSVEGASVKVFLSDSAADRFRNGLFGGLVPVASTESDADGRFDLGAIGFVAGNHVTVSADGFLPHDSELPEVSTGELSIVLARFAEEDDSLAGIVVDQRGEPVEDAWVSLGGAVERTNARGEFVLDPSSTDGEKDTLRAVAENRRPASLELGALSHADRRDLVLVLGDEAWEIGGTVVDGEGRPIANADVWISDADHFGMIAKDFGELSFFVGTSTEELIAGGMKRGIETRSDAAGRFRLHGLLERDYAIHAMHPLTLESACLESVRAGSTLVRIVLSGHDRRARVAGRVVTRAGEPVPGAIVRAHRMLPLASGETPFRGTGKDFGARADENGCFAFEDLAVEYTTLVLDGEGIGTAQTIDLDGEERLEELVFVVPGSCHVRLRLVSDPDLADSFELLDVEGERLDLSFLYGSVTLGSQAAQIEDGVTPLVQTDDSAATLVLFKGGLEVQRIPLELRAGEVNEIDL